MKKNSFTLIELIVSLGIISIVCLIVVGTYVYVVGSREKTLGQMDIQQEGQYIMSSIAKDIRSSKIDYDAYSRPIDSPIGYLILQDIDETNCIHYRRVVSDSRGALQKCSKEKGGKKNCSSVCEEGDFQDLTSQDVDAKSLYFYIHPTEDPFNESSSSAAKKQQPRVTITFNLESLKEKVGKHRIMFQQTILQRWTKRE